MRLAPTTNAATTTSTPTTAKIACLSRTDRASFCAGTVPVALPTAAPDPARIEATRHVSPAPPTLGGAPVTGVGRARAASLGRAPVEPHPVGPRGGHDCMTI